MASLTGSKESLSNTVMQPRFSAGADEGQLITDTKNLVESDWTLDEELMGVKKLYYFKTYTKALVRSFIKSS